MGTFVGHVAPGLAFLAWGIWHMFNILKVYSSRTSFRIRPWYPFGTRFEHLELVLIATTASLSIASELFIFPHRHQPLDDNWSIPSNHLQNFEHSSMSLFFLIYAIIALICSHLRIPEITEGGFLHLLAALAFAQEWLLFHFHSADHMGLEGHYHWLLQLVIAACVAATVVEIAAPSSPLPPLVRSAATMVQGVWLVVMGMVLWLPPLTPRGCKLVNHDGHQVVGCIDRDDERRAKALANLQFNWCIAAVIAATAAALIVAMKRISVNYSSPSKFSVLEDSEEDALIGELEMAAHKSSGSDGFMDFPASVLGR